MALGNPFVIGRDGDRDAVCDRYRGWLWDRIKDRDQRVLAELWAIVDAAEQPGGVELACFCVPQRCHSETISAAARWLAGQAQLRVESLAKQGRPIFVFGSNEEGRHGKGAAAFARDHHGAKWGVGVGLQGTCYGIPTKSSPYQSLPLSRVAEYVEDFLRFAQSRTDLRFHLTRIGCGNAGVGSETAGDEGGLRECDIAALFRGATDNVVCIDDSGDEVGLARLWFDRVR